MPKVAADTPDTAKPAQPATTGTAAAHTPIITDVWSWTARKYRIRATVLLSINLILYCGLCVFTYWLHVGRPFSFTLRDYLEPLRLWGAPTQNLYDFILFPISVDQTPTHGVVIGLLIASIVAVPISVSILYRFKFSLPFVAAVLVFAHMPWMAITLLGSCVMASVRPFRMEFRYGAALLGMLPVLLYLYLATRGSSDPLTASLSPERKLLLTAPWLLAILAACVMMAVIVFIARIVNYRPGAVAPVMAVMFATPAILFYASVGADELFYRVIEWKYGPRSELFEPVQDASGRIIELVQRWLNAPSLRQPQQEALLAFWSDDPTGRTSLRQQVVRQFLLELVDERARARVACAEFIADHPTSRYVPCALFIQGWALDTRLDERALVGEQKQRVLYTDFPHTESEPVWSNLLAQYRDSPLAVAARLRVAQLRLRRGDAPGALAALAPRAAAIPEPVAAIEGRETRSFLRPQPPESTLGYEPYRDLFEAQRLRELIEANAADAKYGVAPLQALLSLDPHRPRYREQLQRLIDEYPECLLRDNLVVRWSATAPDREQRAGLLLACIARFPQGDALPEALFERADMEVQLLGPENPEFRARGIERLRRIAAEFAGTCWGQRARERLVILEEPPTQPARTP